MKLRAEIETHGRMEAVDIDTELGQIHRGRAANAPDWYWIAFHKRLPNGQRVEIGTLPLIDVGGRPQWPADLGPEPAWFRQQAAPVGRPEPEAEAAAMARQAGDMVAAVAGQVAAVAAAARRAHDDHDEADDDNDDRTDPFDRFALDMAAGRFGGPLVPRARRP